MNAICLVIDRLHRGFLGPYGNTWLETPAFNRLAAQGFTFDQALTTSPNLADFYAAVWQAAHPLAAAAQRSTASHPEPPTDLLAALHARGVTTALITDADDVANLPLAAFDDLVRVPPAAERAVATSVDGTALAALFGQAVEYLESAQGPFLLWVHAASLTASFDAPLALRNGLVDEGEPLPSQQATPPRLELSAGFDPDELLCWRRCYAGQALALDELLDGFLSVVDLRPDAAETLLTLVSPRGYCLGEHRRVGSFDAPFYSELVHVPWLLRLPAERGGSASGRSQALVQPADLCATLAGWFAARSLDLPWDARDLTPLIREDAAWPRDRIAIAGGADRALRTVHWHFRQAGQTQDTGAAPLELFVKPDDLWDQNEIATRCVKVAEQLAGALAEYEQIASVAPSTLPAPLAEIVSSGMR